MPVDYLTPTEFSRYHRAWYARPWFYLPLALVVVVLVAGLLAGAVVMAIKRIKVTRCLAIGSASRPAGSRRSATMTLASNLGRSSRLGNLRCNTHAPAHNLCLPNL